MAEPGLGKIFHRMSFILQEITVEYSESMQSIESVI